MPPTSGCSAARRRRWLAPTWLRVAMPNLPSAAVSGGARARSPAPVPRRRAPRRRRPPSRAAAGSQGDPRRTDPGRSRSTRARDAGPPPRLPRRPRHRKGEPAALPDARARGAAPLARPAAPQPAPTASQPAPTASRPRRLRPPAPRRPAFDARSAAPSPAPGSPAVAPRGSRLARSPASAPAPPPAPESSSPEPAPAPTGSPQTHRRRRSRFRGGRAGTARPGERSRPGGSSRPASTACARRGSSPGVAAGGGNPVRRPGARAPPRYRGPAHSYAVPAPVRAGRRARSLPRDDRPEAGCSTPFGDA